MIFVPGLDGAGEDLILLSDALYVTIPVVPVGIVSSARHRGHIGGSVSRDQVARHVPGIGETSNNQKARQFAPTHGPVSTARRG